MCFFGVGFVECWKCVAQCASYETLENEMGCANQRLTDNIVLTRCFPRFVFGGIEEKTILPSNNNNGIFYLRKQLFLK